MASIYPNLKDGKIVSYKFKAYLGRDDDGKQIITETEVLQPFFEITNKNGDIMYKDF